MEYKYRTQLYLSEEHYQFLKERSARYNISMAEVVRRLIEEEMEKGEAFDPQDPIFRLVEESVATGRPDGSISHDKYIYRDLK